MFKRSLAIAFALCLLCVGCSKDTPETQQAPDPTSKTLTLGMSEEELEFTLTSEDTPTFSELEDDTELGNLLADVPELEPQPELEQEEPQPEPEQEEPVERPSAVEPTPETKYPNTGIFLEDD